MFSLLFQSISEHSMVFRLRRMHEMQTIVTNVRAVCLSVRPSVRQSVCHVGSFGAAFAKILWPLVGLSIGIACARGSGRRVTQSQTTSASCMPSCVN